MLFVFSMQMRVPYFGLDVLSVVCVLGQELFYIFDVVMKMQNLYVPMLIDEKVHLFVHLLITFFLLAFLRVYSLNFLQVF